MNRSLITTDLPDELEKVIPQTSIRYMEGIDTYTDAKKSGMELHAFATVKKCLRKEKLEEIFSHLRNDGPVYIIPVSIARGNHPSVNKLPVCMAWTIADILSHSQYRSEPVTVVENITGKSLTANTGKGIKARLQTELSFSGGLPDTSLEAQYVIVDDVFTLGGTVRGLLEHVLNQGGRVRAVSSLGCSRFGAGLRPTPEQLEKIYAYGIDNQQIKEITGHDINQFTGAELTAINGFYRDKTPEHFREIFPERDFEITQKFQGMVEESPGVYGVDLEGPETGFDLSF